MRSMLCQKHSDSENESWIVKMSALKKIIVVLLVTGVATLLTCGALLWWFLPSSDWLRSGIESKIAEASNTKVTIGSFSVGLSLRGPVRVSASDVMVKGLHGQETLLVKQVEMTPSLSGMIQGRISISSIEMESVKALVTIDPHGAYQYPFVPLPIKTEGDQTTADSAWQSAQQLSSADPDKTQPSGNVGSQIAWSINSVRATDVTLELVDMRTVSTPDRRVTLGIAEINLRQAGSANTFDIIINGATLRQSENIVSKFNGLGPLRLNETLDGIEKVDFQLNIDSADFASISGFIPKFGEAFKQLTVTGARLDLGYAASSGTKIGFRGSVSHATGPSAPLKIAASCRFPSDFSAVTDIEVNGEASKVPLLMFAPLAGAAAPSFGAGLWSGTFSFNQNSTGEWSIGSDLQLENVHLLPESGLGIKNPTISILADGTWESMDLRELNANDHSVAMKLSGRIIRPLSDSRVLDLNADFLFRSPANVLKNLVGASEIEIKGPLRLNGSIKGPANKSNFELQADMRQCSLDFSGKLSKPAEKKWLLWLKGAISTPENIKGATPQIDALFGTELHGVNVTSGHAKPVTGELGFNARSRFLYGTQGIDFREFDVELKRNKSANFLIKIRGSAIGLSKGAAKVTASVQTNFDAQLLSLLGLDDSGNLKIDGQTTISTKLNQSKNAYTFSIEAPLKNLDISYDKTFGKKAGVDGSLIVSGNYSGNVTTLSSSSLSLPGLAASATGTIANKKNGLTEIDLKLKEVDLKKLTSVLPELAKQDLAGRCRAQLILKNDKSDFLPTGSIQIESLQFKPEKSMVFFDSVAGSAKINGKNLDDISLDGRVRGFVEAPIRCYGSLQDIYGIENLKGNISANIGHGAIKLQHFKGNMAKPQAVISALGASLLNNPNIASPEFSYIRGDFAINRGIAQTENLEQVGGDLRSAIVGSIDLRNNNINAALWVKAMISPPEQIGKIPAVRELVKKHEGILKMTGLDKELKKLGIESGDQKSPDSGQSKPAKHPINMIFRLSGNAGDAQVMPTFENSLGEPLSSKLKALIEAPPKQ